MIDMMLSQFSLCAAEGLSMESIEPYVARVYTHTLARRARDTRGGQ